MQFDPTSMFVGFLVGAFTGAAGGYLADKYTDQRRKQEETKQSRRKFDAVCHQMPDFIKEMRDDLTQKPHVREFFLLEEGSAFGIKNSDAFVYRFSEKRPVRSWAKILENQGYVIEITPKSTPKYRMAKEFVNLIQEIK